jgi:hypothetical protein
MGLCDNIQTTDATIGDLAVGEMPVEHIYNAIHLVNLSHANLPEVAYCR